MSAPLDDIRTERQLVGLLPEPLTPAGWQAPAHKIAILGTRGIPAGHGGFETFAEHLALFLSRRGWDVQVYCQNEEGQEGQTNWRGVTLCHVPTSVSGSRGSIAFDAKAQTQTSTDPGRLVLTLGYNTAVFGLLSRLRGCVQLINMDGLEWRRAKWSRPVKAWFWLNERLACWTADHLIADNPRIADHLATRVARQHITVIPYGAERVYNSDPSLLDKLGLKPRTYALIVARPEPENQILEMVRAFSTRSRNIRLAVLGSYRRDTREYDRSVLAAASPDVIFPGAIYDQPTLRALREYSVVYLHGHQVGGTNPSLVEALGAGSPVLAHDNPFNRWVAGPTAVYFRNEAECERHLTGLLTGDPGRLAQMRAGSYARHSEDFTWTKVLSQYEALLEHWSREAQARCGSRLDPQIGAGAPEQGPVFSNQN